MNTQSMRCNEVTALFSEFIDNELSQGVFSGIKRHLSICKGCKAEYEIFKKGVHLIKKFEPLDPLEAT